MSLKQKIFHEMVEYWINVVYLALVLAAFTQYQLEVDAINAELLKAKNNVIKLDIIKGIQTQRRTSQ